MVNFRMREINALKALYNEEMDHFRCVLCERMVDVFQECGEKVTLRRVVNLFKEYVQSDMKLFAWKDFMDIVNHVKRDKMNPSLPIANLASGVANVVQGQVIASLMGPKVIKYGNWEVLYNNFAERSYYHNIVTDEKRWDLPDEIRFYIPEKLLDKLFDVFDYGHLENFKYQFSIIDVNSSGDISEPEMKMLLEQMGIVVDDGMIRKLMKTIDLNGNGTIEFDEFCYMMYCIRTQGGGDSNMAGIWDELQVASNYNEDKQEAKEMKMKQNQQKDMKDANSKNAKRGDGVLLPTLEIPRSNGSNSSANSGTSTPNKTNSRKTTYASPTKPPPKHLLTGSVSDPDKLETGSAHNSVKQRKRLGEVLFQLSDGHYMAGQQMNIGRSESSSSFNSPNGDSYNSSNANTLPDLHIQRNDSTDSTDYLVLKLSGSEIENGSRDGSVTGVVARSRVAGKKSSLMNDGSDNEEFSCGKSRVARTSSMNWENGGGGSASNSRPGSSTSFLPSISAPNSPTPTISRSPINSPVYQSEDISNPTTPLSTTKANARKRFDTGTFNSNMDSINENEERTEPGSKPGSTFLDSLASNSAKLKKQISFGSLNDESTASGFLSTRSGSMKLLSNVSSRISTAVKDTKKMARKTVNLVSAKAVEMQRAVAEAINGEVDLYVDEDGETHDKYCFCGCRCER